MRRRLCESASRRLYDRAVRPRPERLERLPQQYFVSLLAKVAAAGPDVVDLGRGNPDVGPPAHVVERLAEAARDPSAHGYAPIRGLPALREAIAGRYRDVYGVELDPEREVAIVPGTKTGFVELGMCLVEEGETLVLPEPWYPDYPSAVAFANAKLGTVPLDPGSGWAPDFSRAPRERVGAVFLNYPCNPCAVAVPPGAFDEAVAYARETGAAVVHDFAYGDLVFDGRAPESFLATPGAKEVGVELFTMSKTYGMSGWRVGFVLGNAEIVERVNVMNDHTRVGIFSPVAEACIAALTGPQDSVATRVASYQARRDRVLEALPVEARCEGTFFFWVERPNGVSADELLAEHGVAVAPGEGFGPSGAGWMRLSLAVPDDRLDLGLERLAGAYR
jgi:aminotransferase